MVALCLQGGQFVFILARPCGLAGSCAKQNFCQDRSGCVEELSSYVRNWLQHTCWVLHEVLLTCDHAYHFCHILQILGLAEVNRIIVTAIISLHHVASRLSTLQRQKNSLELPSRNLSVTRSVRCLLSLCLFFQCSKLLSLLPGVLDFWRWSLFYCIMRISLYHIASQRPILLWINKTLDSLDTMMAVVSTFFQTKNDAASAVLIDALLHILYALG